MGTTEESKISALEQNTLSHRLQGCFFEQVKREFTLGIKKADTGDRNKALCHSLLCYSWLRSFELNYTNH